MERPQVHIPFRMWGDDVAATKNKSIDVIHCTSAVADRVKAVFSRLLCCAFPLSFILPEGIDKLMSVLVWSFVALSTGEWPSTDWTGTPFPVTCWRHGKAALKLAGGFCAIVCEVAGDWKFLKELLRLPQHYGKTICCHICKALKIASGGLAFTDFKSSAEHRRQRRCAS